MLTPIAYGLAIALDLLVLLIGAVPDRPPRGGSRLRRPAKPGGDPAYLTVKGLRDGTYALVGLALLAFAGRTPRPGSCWPSASYRSATP
ncbi:MAG: hypothetical protein ACRDL9_02125 [Trebonia sp.]